MVLEVDFIYNPTDHLLISGGYGYADAEFADGNSLDWRQCFL